jgi:hypothetical protein
MPPREVHSLAGYPEDGDTKRNINVVHYAGIYTAL